MTELLLISSAPVVEHHVVFVHGLTNSSEGYWQSSGHPPEPWPVWLKDDLKSVAIWEARYEAPRTRWRGAGMSLADRGDNVLALLSAEPRLQSGHISFVTHSFGGLVVEQVLRVAEAKSSSNQSVATIARNTRRVAFLGTPHRGADLAGWARRLRIPVRPSSETLGLNRNDPGLRDLNYWFRNYASRHQLETLTLIESRKSRWFGHIVKPDSGDAGLSTTPIFVAADHDSIRSPESRNSEVYRLLVDFLAKPPIGGHADTLLADRVDALGGVVDVQAKNVLNRLDTLTAAVSSSRANPAGALLEAEVLRRLSLLRRARFYEGSDTKGRALALYRDLNTGELAGVSGATRRLALAWCARLLCSPPPEINTLEEVFEAAHDAGDSDDLSISNAIRIGYAGNKAAALARLAEINLPASRSASFRVATYDLDPEAAIVWWAQSGIRFEDIDSDGRFFILQKYIECGRWNEALEVVKLLADGDFSATPVLYFLTALTNLAQAVPEEFRGYLRFGVPFESSTQPPLASDSQAIRFLRVAIEQFDASSRAATELQCERAAGLSSDMSLWLRLRATDTRELAIRELGQSMRDGVHSLRRIGLALHFGIKLDIGAVEREIDRQIALTGGKSVDAAVARFALAFVQPTPIAAAEYISRYRAYLLEFLDPKAIGDAEVQLLAKSGRIREATERLRELERLGLDPHHRIRLERLVAEPEAADPLEAIEDQFKKSDKLADLIHVVEVLTEKRDWASLLKYARIYFERTHSLAAAGAYAHSLSETNENSELASFLATYPELVEQSDSLRELFSWALFREGRLQEAKLILAGLLQTRDSGNDRSLSVNISIASGDWESLATFLEQEWSKKDERSAQELLRAGQLAAQVGSGRAQPLIRAAAEKGSSDPAILVGCYSAATSSGWEEEADVSSWMQAAAALSGEDGPVKSVSIRELLDMRPDWEQRESETWKNLESGGIPTFAAARLLNRSLIDMFLFPALANQRQDDVRRRGIIFAYSGGRLPVQQLPRSATFDPTALLTLALLHQTKPVFDSFESVVIPHTTMQWLLRERQKIQFHQPSRLRAAEEIRRLVDSGALRQLQDSADADIELKREIGDDLASLFAEARGEVGDDGKQRLVIRPGPVHRIGSLLEEETDLSSYSDVLSGCQEVIEALRSRGVLTRSEEVRATTYLGPREKKWPWTATINDNAVLLLDSVAVSHFQHLGILPRLAAAGFTAVLPRREVAEADALIEHASLATEATNIIEMLRRDIEAGIRNGKVRLGRLKLDDDPDADFELRQHPSSLLFEAAEVTDAVVADDRYFNQHPMVVSGSSQKVLLSTLDVLSSLREADSITESLFIELRTQLRKAGYCLIPIDAAELIVGLDATKSQEGALIETAELKAIRESVVRLRMSDALQLPAELRWLDGLSDAIREGVRAQWNDSVSDEIAKMRSDWLLPLGDVRGWAHRLPAFSAETTPALLLMRLISISFSQDEATRARFLEWLGPSLDELKAEAPQAYNWLVAYAAGLVERVAGGLKE